MCLNFSIFVSVGKFSCTHFPVNILTNGKILNIFFLGMILTIGKVVNINFTGGKVARQILTSYKLAV